MLVNFAVGVVTGITLEFQFGMNWAEYSKFVGDIFGAPLAIEATVAFFLESTFIGVWMFSWKRVSRGVHAGIMWVVASASTLSALWILLANGWMQRPRGYELVGGKAVLTSFGALLSSPYAWIKFWHVIASAYTLTAFFIMGISAIQLLRKKNEEMFRRSFRIAASFGIVTSIMIVFAGDLSGVQVAKYQPSKLAAMESQWETEKGADFFIFQVPPAGEITPQFLAWQINQRPAFILTDAIGDKAVFSGLVRLERGGERAEGLPSGGPSAGVRRLHRFPAHGRPGLSLRPPCLHLRHSRLEEEALRESLVPVGHELRDRASLPGL